MRRHLYNTVRKYALAGITGAALIAPVAANARLASDAIVLHRSGAIVTQDLRSPDAVLPVTQQPVQVDLRSPDATVPVVTPSTHVVSQPTATPSTSDNGFDFGSAAIGAGIALLLGFACACGMVAVNRRRTPAIGS